jgi:hypothetical protein
LNIHEPDVRYTLTMTRVPAEAVLILLRPVLEMLGITAEEECQCGGERYGTECRCQGQAPDDAEPPAGFGTFADSVQTSEPCLMSMTTLEDEYARWCAIEGASRKATWSERHKQVRDELRERMGN